ncbi:hypothetical protein ACIRPT_00235 [Streptomyces sp. NPDC101227]
MSEGIAPGLTRPLPGIYDPTSPAKPLSAFLAVTAETERAASLAFS